MPRLIPLRLVVFIFAAALPAVVILAADPAPPLKKILFFTKSSNFEHSVIKERGGQPGFAAQILAVHVLTHESMHMSGTTSEAVAECHAMQHDTAMAEDLGAPAAAAHALAVTYWHTVYPYMPDGYTSGDCKPGGALDLHLPDAPWAPLATT